MEATEAEWRGLRRDEGRRERETRMWESSPLSLYVIPHRNTCRRRVVVEYVLERLAREVAPIFHARSAGFCFRSIAHFPKYSKSLSSDNGTWASCRSRSRVADEWECFLGYPSLSHIELN